ncbi:MAG: undecaprenyldiphospho-muramoylpentapeptide beta-N-acetylglucosaminyltransferase [Slackia sp.]|nr:undecaprenyldiphospho-muramoylpentapeptide beta-N-acetylglucosaminyltransferase [Slackia sp.]
MKIVLSGGGTAGHINPALALAEVLVERGCEVCFAGTPTGVEARLVAQAGLEYVAFEAAGFDRQRPLTLLTSTAKIAASTCKAKRWMRDARPDAVVGFGGYVCIPVGLAASSLRIPLAVHEQNSVMGMANKFLAKRADAVALTYEEAGSGLADASKAVVTGNPVRSSVLSATRAQGRALLGIPDDARMLLVFGGSLGARHINEAVASLKDALLSRDDLYVVHITGPKEYDAVRERLALDDEQAKRWIVMAYQDRMAETLAAADCAIARAGATSLAEISAIGLPALLVPFPYAAEDHQTTNARAYVAGGAAFSQRDDELEDPAFAEKLFALVDDASVRARMHEAAAAFKTQDAAANLADVVCRVARGR